MAWPFLLWSALLGWFSGWLAERRNAYAWWVPVVMGVIAVGGGLGLFSTTANDRAGMWPFIILCIAGFIGGGLTRWKGNT